MNIAFYAPFKPIDHPTPSGDQTIARGIVRFLEKRGHCIMIQSRLRTRWVYFTPWKWPLFGYAFVRVLISLKFNPPDIWLTYHSYYKSPDILGPWICRLLKIRYIIFQGIYSSKRKRSKKTVMGYRLNLSALKQAEHVFSNKLSDFENLKRLKPDERLTYIQPGIICDTFKHDNDLGKRLKHKWGIENAPVILTAAMFRDDVKTKGLLWLINCCGELITHGVSFYLVVAGSGPMEHEIKRAADLKLAGHTRFVGKMARKDMVGFYSTGDVFAFPGIRESLGMVFLEAQSCGVPVVAFDNGGIPEVVVHGKTGFLTPMYDGQSFNNYLIRLLLNDALRDKMGKDAAGYVRNHHDLDHNYRQLENRLRRIVSS